MEGEGADMQGGEKEKEEKAEACNETSAVLVISSPLAAQQCNLYVADANQARSSSITRKAERERERVEEFEKQNKRSPSCTTPQTEAPAGLKL